MRKADGVEPADFDAHSSLAGQLTLHGPARKLLADPELRTAYLGES